MPVEFGTPGPPGPPGDPGPEGPRGPQGDVGSTGPQGPLGASGPTGDRGPQGPAGPTGPAGPQGAQGAAGTGMNLRGTLADTGELPTDAVEGDAYLIGGDAWVYSGTEFFNAGQLQGPAGPAGADGATGPQGPPGDPGAAGPQGEPGPPGDLGPAGPAGAAGAAGAQGPKGDTGDTGPTGPTGPAGPAGADGAAGPQGPAGAQGPQGVAGSQGPKGDTGAQGPQGTQGVAGLPRGVQDEGVDLPARSKLNFVGSGVAATDDSGNDRTIVTVTQPAGATATPTATALPSSPTDGQEFVYVAESAINAVWRLRYNATAAKWQCVGGMEARGWQWNSNATGKNSGAIGTFAEVVPTNGALRWTVALAGTYNLRLSPWPVQNPSGAATAVTVRIGLGYSLVPGGALTVIGYNVTTLAAASYALPMAFETIWALAAGTEVGAVFATDNHNVDLLTSGVRLYVKPFSLG